MSSDQLFIGVDWGTSRMRAMLCSHDRSAPSSDEVVFGDGISKLTKSPEDTLFEAITPWIKQYGKLDIVLAGMVGSNIGWKTTPYLPCPAQLSNLPNLAEVFEVQGHKVTILPGAKGTNAMGQPDLMRGEELQILGWMARHPNISHEDRLICLPGTHTKWARLHDGQLESFATSLTGELYAILKDHSILVPSPESQPQTGFQNASFLKGAKLAAQQPNGLLHILFSTRTRLISNPDELGDPASYLSGLLIGSDVKTAIDNCAKPNVIVEVIGAPALGDKYALAIENLGHTCNFTDGNDAIYSGFLAV
ncbi:2-dehydro-3-deoxygalactonokinase [Hirschia maritima]|uniref:2-dehydro-3-deoxygalactonokinase n=1 Tax=Hirschia maritima TaxID=1121961 RepID=UPI0003615430|nr:2-dehydro-3-deoxygalactonokinase [Hirschia maritima]